MTTPSSLKTNLPGIARSTLLVMAATLVSNLLGFGREIVNARYFGTHWELDTFLAAATIPTIIFGIFNGALVSALVPVFSTYLARGEEESAWALANTVFNVLALVLVLCAVAGWVLAPWYVPVIAHGFPQPQLQIAVRMTRWLMPGIIATSLAGIINAMLNAYHRFTAAALQGIAINVVTILVTIACVDRLGIYALVLGTVCGLIASLFVQVPSYLLLRHYRFSVDLRHPGLRSIWLMLGPIVIGSAAGQLALFFDRFFASTLSPGYISGMNYAMKLVGFPQQLFAAAIATVIFPLLANQFSSDDVAGVRRSTVTGLRVVNFLTVPAVFGLNVLAAPLVRTLFERGEFTSGASLLCASLLPYAAFSLIPIAANIVLTRCAFACHESRWTVAASVLSVGLNIVFSLLLLPSLGAKGLLLANGLSQWMQTLVLLVLVRRLVPGLEWRGVFIAGARVTLASLVMAIAVLTVRNLFGDDPVEWIWRLAALLAQICFATVVFFATAKLFGANEVDELRNALARKVNIGASASCEAKEFPVA